MDEHTRRAPCIDAYIMADRKCCETPYVEVSSVSAWSQGARARGMMMAISNQRSSYQEFVIRAAKRKERATEPPNGGPSKVDFVQIVGSLAKDGKVHGTVLKRLRQPKAG